jgi:hypothetical protein
MLVQNLTSARYTPKRRHRSAWCPEERETMTTIRLVTPFTSKSTAADVVAGIDLSSRRAKSYDPRFRPPTRYYAASLPRRHRPARLGARNFVQDSPQSLRE